MAKRYCVQGRTTSGKWIEVDCFNTRKKAENIKNKYRAFYSKVGGKFRVRAE
jgi:hypothetical protein